MKNEAQNRILLLLQYLQSHTDETHTVSVTDILRYWQEHGITASRKSVYNDVDLLTQLGMDIICVKSTQNRYFIGSRLFELPELKLLADAVESSHFITEKKSAALLEKLGRLTSEHQAGSLDRPVYMAGTAKPDNETIYYSVDAIQTAIHEKRQISFQYYDYTPQKEKILKHDGYRYLFSPYALIWNRDFYYAVGWSERHGKPAQFRVDRMANVEALEQAAVSVPDFDPAAYVRQVFGMYDSGQDGQRTVELLCENETMRSVVDRFGEGVETEPVDGSHFRAVAEVVPSPPFYAWVFTFGGKIRIAAPADVLAEMKNMAAWLV